MATANNKAQQMQQAGSINAMPTVEAIRTILAWEVFAQADAPQSEADIDRIKLDRSAFMHLRRHCQHIA